MRVLVLGDRGMLGHVAVRFFRERGRDVCTVGARFDPGSPGPFLDAVRAAGADVVVNGIGAVKQRTDDTGVLLALNAALPLLLRLALPPRTVLVHPSSDCVFSGADGWYDVSRLPDAVDAYGLSKALGEAVARYPSTIVIRASIVGPQLSGAHGLLAWFLSQPRGALVSAYSDHLWNGVTTLEWCRVAEELLAAGAGTAERGTIVQPGTERRWTKAEMLRAFRDAYAHDVTLQVAATGKPVDRTLRPTTARKPFEDQLRELLAWYGPPRSA